LAGELRVAAGRRRNQLCLELEPQSQGSIGCRVASVQGHDRVDRCRPDRSTEGRREEPRNVSRRVEVVEMGHLEAQDFLEPDQGRSALPFGHQRRVAVQA
jgi:hypothetical protein